MDYEEAGREAYEAANAALLGLADRLVAVWDEGGGEAGGTAAWSGCGLWSGPKAPRELNRFAFSATNRKSKPGPLLMPYRTSGEAQGNHQQ